MEPIIQVSDLKKRYHKAKEFALKGVQLAVNSGDFLGLLGPNGSGKTTMISILCGLRTLTTGHVTVLGKKIPKQLREIKSNIGLVPQDLALYQSLTFNENLKFIGHLYGISGKRLKQRIDECAEVAHLGRFADRPIQTYSGGMKRRANLAASLLHEPKILFLDEPTVNVDPQSRNVIFDIIQKLNRQGTTMIYTTHYLEEAQFLCNRIAIMDKGIILCNDTPANLIAENNDCKDLGEVFLKLTGTHLRD